MDFMPIVLTGVSTLIGTCSIGLTWLLRRKITKANTASKGGSRSGLKDGIDAVVQTPLRYTGKKLEIENKKQNDLLDQKKIAQNAELEKQKTLLEIEKQQLEIERQRLVLQKERRDYVLETLSQLLQYNIDTKTKEMLIRHLLFSLFQIGSTEN